ncbi:MAG: AAA family ATPase [Armatimonadetes bacterium]|nr:AAA family ATPase [Armatimonadota bacterium]
MIKRIKEITNVGTFSNFKDGGKIQFESLTLIYGLNSFGKSTLTDIFRSISLKNNSILQNRKTIPSKYNDLQNIKISYYKDIEEKNIEFKNNNWQLNDYDYYLQIFDSRFINENVFTGLNITRENKVNITDFILGEENVKTALELADLKKEKRTMSGDHTRLKDRINEAIIEYHIDIKEFFRIKTDFKREEIKTKIESLTNQKLKLEEKIKNADSIIKKKEPVQSKTEINVIKLLDKINLLFKKSFDEINEEAFSKLSNHINNNFQKRDNDEEKWIEKGLFDYLKTEELEKTKCPFCGQRIEDIELIETYKKYFNESFKEFEENIKKELSSTLNQLIEENNRLKLSYKDNIIIFKEYLSIVDNQDFNQDLNELELISGKVENAFQNFKKVLNESVIELKAIIEKKNQKPYEAIPEYDYFNILQSETDYDEIQNDYLLKENNLIQQIKDFKLSLQNEEIKIELEKIIQEISKYTLLKLRIVNEPIFQKLIEVKAKIDDFGKKIIFKTIELEKNQELFLKNYFDLISLFFKKFGCKDYQITKSISKTGYKPVISIHLKYKNIKINEKNISYVLSDSERRALALSIFWAKLITKTKSEKENTIIILDDPVTSFDENRKLKTVGEIFNICNDFRQIIILTHYDNFLKKILESNNNKFKHRLLKINRNNNTSFLEEFKEESFILTEHEKAFNKIESFINRKHNEDISKNLRPFLENEIKLRFRKQILDNKLENLNLEKIIDGLYENKIFVENTKDYIHNNFRIILNPEHHTLSENNPEDIRTLAQDMMNFIYSDLRAN